MARLSLGLGSAAALSLALLLPGPFPTLAAEGESAVAAQGESAFAAVADGPIPAPAGGPESVMPLREALLLALRHNLDMQVARSGPRMAAEQLAQARGAFDPVASFGSGYDQDEQLGPTGGKPDWRGEMKQGAELKGALPLGLTYMTRYTLTRERSRSGEDSRGDGQGRSFQSEITLPLMRDLRMNEPRAGMLRGELGERAARADFASKLAELVASVETLYWDLAAAQAEQRVAQRSLQLGHATLEQTRAQEEMGMAAQLDVSKAQAGLAKRELDEIRAQNAAERARDALLGAVLAPDATAYADREVAPEPPTFSRYAVDLERAIANALRTRPDLAAARERLQISELEQELSQNQLRPRLDLSAGYRAGDASSRTRSGAAEQDGEPLALEPSSQSANRGFSLQARFEMPLGNRSARARAEQRSIELRRSRAEFARLRQSVVLDVRAAVGELHSAEKAVHAAERRRAAAAVVLAGAQERLQLGEATPLDVLTADGDVTAAERDLIDALRDHRNAITGVERSQGRLLDARGIDVQAALKR